MPAKAVSNVKLGIFVLAGLLFLILLLYMIGKNSNLFQASYVLKARLSNVQGLVVGNNVRFAGIETGTVKRISFVNDSIIEVTMLIDKKMINIIRNNAIVSIGTEGLVGNKVVNIIASGQQAPFAKEGDVLVSQKAVSTEDMMATLSSTNKDVAVIAAELKKTVQRINNSSTLWTLLNDESIPLSIRASAGNIRTASGKAAGLLNELNTIVSNVKEGKGSVGALLTDSSFANNLGEALIEIKAVSHRADSIATSLDNLVAGVQNDLNSGKGPIHALLKDTAIVVKLNASLDNIQKGTDGFNQNMEALKHNFLLRGYFKKLEKKQKEGQPNAY